MTATMPRTRSNFIRTYTGKEFYPLDANPADVDLDDIAHALSNICRFTGHVKHFYSVAQHSVYVSRLSYPSERMIALLHDASEAYICDIARPIKHSGAMNEYLKIEENLMNVIYDHFELPHGMPKSVHYADNLMLSTEMDQLMHGSPYDPDKPDNVLPRPMSRYAFLIPQMAPDAAKQFFLDEYTKLLITSRGTIIA